MTVETMPGLRERAAETFEKLGWPTPRLEEWRYTNLAPVQKIAWRTDDSGAAAASAAGSTAAPTVGAAAASAAGASATLAGQHVLELLFLNGRLVSQTGESPFATPDRATVADWERNAMVALNTANAQDGARIEIPANAIVQGFVHLLFVGQGDGVWSHPRNVIVVGDNAQVTIVESYVGTGTYFTNAVTEIHAGENAIVDHYRLQSESSTAFHVGNVFIEQQRAATVTSRSVLVGGAIARSETHVALAGEGASIVLDGLFVGAGAQHLDNRTVIDHIKPHCESYELYKGILDDSARGVFDGRIIVRPDAQKTVSKQENRNLLLSETAIVDSKPTLEIHNDDVKCNHGSTIGQIDAQQLFYLQSRGISEDEARNLLVLAFAGQIIDRMKIEPVREQIRRALFQTLPERLPERRAGK